MQCFQESMVFPDHFISLSYHPTGWVHQVKELTPMTLSKCVATVCLICICNCICALVVGRYES